MAENIQRSKGRAPGYRFDRGGTPTEFGPFIGVVVNNIDPTRAGRLQVWIAQFGATTADGAPDFDARDTWRTVNYIPPFYGATPHTGTSQGTGTFTGNQQSYGMWFTPPDLYTQVICFFVGGDPNQGYYLGCIPDLTINHMVPAVGASDKFQLANGAQDAYFADVTQLPVTEINNENNAVYEQPRFFDQTRPVHSFVAGVMLQQGLIKDTVRGPITSSSQRESPSAVFGISTPGRAIYQGGLSERDIKQQVESGQLRPEQVEVIARRGGHSLVMDDGDLDGADNLVRIRTAKGHQITMSDDGNCFYIIHANGQTWLEFGVEGTVDVFSTNSVNIRTQGEINLHADKAINMFAGEGINVKSKNIKAEASADMSLLSTNKTTVYSKGLVGIKSDGALNCQSASGAWDAGSAMNLIAGSIGLNSGGSASVESPTSLKDFELPDVKFVVNVGWQVEQGALKSIVTRAPTHEPYPYHNEGVNVQVSLADLPSPEPNPVTTKRLQTVQDTPVQNPVTAADVATQPPAELPVGSIDTAQVQASLAQTAKDVDQSATAVSADKGVGKYGISPKQLEAAGFIKPGTVGNYLKDPSQIQSVLANPSVWTGKKNVGGLDQLLGDVKLQSLTQNEIMVASLDGLKQAGAVSGKESPEQLASLVQLGSKFGVNNAVGWVQGNAPADLINQMNAAAKNAQFSVNLSDKLADAGQVLKQSAEGFKATVNRASINKAFADVLGDPKIPIPEFSPEPIATGDLQSLAGSLPSIESLSGVLDRNIIGELSGAGLPAGIPGLGGLNIGAVGQQAQQALAIAQTAGTKVFRSLAEQLPSQISTTLSSPPQPFTDITGGPVDLGRIARNTRGRT